MGADKAPGSDGFQMFFFQKHWEMMHPNLIWLCDDFYSGRASLEHINWANITLIPKETEAVKIGDYHSISLINSSLKIISKILDNHLGCAINNKMDQTQIVFIKKKSITDNIVEAEELIFSIQKWNLDGHILKVDFVKAFDMVYWEFPKDVEFLKSSKSKILISASLTSYLWYQHWLRLGY